MENEEFLIVEVEFSSELEKKLRPLFKRYRLELISNGSTIDLLNKHDRTHPLPNLSIFTNRNRLRNRASIFLQSF